MKQDLGDLEMVIGEQEIYTCDYPACGEVVAYKGLVEEGYRARFAIADRMAQRAGLFERHVKVCSEHVWILDPNSFYKVGGEK